MFIMNSIQFTKELIGPAPRRPDPVKPISYGQEANPIGSLSTDAFKHSETGAFAIVGGEKENQSKGLLFTKTFQTIAASPSSEKPCKKAKQFIDPNERIPNLSKVFSESVL